MPLYDFRCLTCAAVAEHLARPNDAVPCDTCGGATERLITVPSTYPAELAPYYDNGLGAYIESRQQRRGLMQKYHLEEKGTTHMHGAKGTIFSQPGHATRSVKPSGAFAPRTKDGFQA